MTEFGNRTKKLEGFRRWSVMRFMHRVIPLVLGLLLVALPIQAALAQNAGETKIIDRIAAVYGSSASDLQAMRAAGLGWGEIIMVLELSSRSGTSVSDIQAMHAGGMGFGQIAKELGVDPADLGRAVANVMSEGRSGGQASGTAGAVGREHSNGKGKP